MQGRWDAVVRANAGEALTEAWNLYSVRVWRRALISAALIIVLVASMDCASMGAVAWIGMSIQNGETETVPASEVEVVDAPSVPAVAMRMPGLVELWLRSYVGTTRTTYRSAVADYEATIGEPIEQLLVGCGQANGRAALYRVKMLERKLSASSINVRLSALRSFVAHARRLQLVEWTLDVPAMPSKAYRDTRGPGVSAVRSILVAAQHSPAPERDRAILWALYGLALRRGEVASLDLSHVDFATGRLYIAGKGSAGARIPVSMPHPLVDAIKTWIVVRPPGPGPLFPHLRGRGEARQWCGRISTRSIARLLLQAATAAGVGPARPHGLRHTAISEALRRTKDVRKVARFSRHADLRTVQVYDDNLDDDAGAISALISEEMAVVGSDEV